MTGASGQDGTYLVERLLEQDWEVHTLVHGVRDKDKNPLPKQCTEYVGDLGDVEAVANVVLSSAPDVIFNLGGISSVARSWKEPVLTGRVTGLTVAGMLEAALEVQESEGRPVRFVQASSAEIFGAALETPQTEDTPLAPISPYGAAKAYAHTMVGAYRSKGLEASSCILYNHESPRRPRTFVTRKITSTVAEIAFGLKTELTLGALDIRRDWGWAPDFVDALMRAGSTPKADDFIIATGQSHSIAEFVEESFKAAGISNWQEYTRIDSQFQRPADSHELRGNPRKAEEILGWSPTVNFKELVTRMTVHDLQIVEQSLNRTIRSEIS